MDDLVALCATELAALLASGEVAAREVVAAHLRRIEEVDGRINAIVTRTPELALEAAARADDAHAHGASLGVLHGLPIAHKDLNETAGIRTTYGWPATRDFVPAESSLVVERLWAAGAIPVGKTNVPELGAGSQTFNRIFGATRNPYDLAKTVGGSSGGAAAALAARMVPIADGSDMGGSLRNPAAFSNVVGFRPSPGRVPSHPKLDIWGHLSTEGPMARTVADVALLLQAMAGPDPRSPIALDDPGSVFAGRLDPPRLPVRVAWAPTLGGLPVAPVVRDTLSTVPKVLDGLGWHVQEACPDLRDAEEIFQVRRAWAFELNHGPDYDTDPAMFKDTIRWNIEEARRRSLSDHADAVRKHAGLYHRVREFFEHHDVLVCPTTQVAPFDVEQEWVHEIDGVPMTTYIEWMRSCTDVTVMGCPSISLPAGFTPDGLPVGVQFVGRPRGDRDLLAMAAAYEAATGFWQMAPGL